jgi:hypothetical protein
MPDIESWLRHSQAGLNIANGHARAATTTAQTAAEMARAVGSCGYVFVRGSLRQLAQRSGLKSLMPEVGTEPPSQGCSIDRGSIVLRGLHGNATVLGCASLKGPRRTPNVGGFFLECLGAGVAYAAGARTLQKRQR